MKHCENEGHPLVVGVTGGIASGKSTVLKELGRLGAVTISADEISRRVTKPDGAAYNSVVAAFGNEILLPEGQIDRHALAARIFSNPSERKRLESLLHPIIMEEIWREIAHFRNHPPNFPPIAAIEIPLLFEIGAEGMVDQTLVAAVEQVEQIHRLKQRTPWSDTVIREAIESQMPLSEKMKRADAVISTEGSMEETLSRTLEYWNGITRPYLQDHSLNTARRAEFSDVEDPFRIS